MRTSTTRGRGSGRQGRRSAGGDSHAAEGGGAGGKDTGTDEAAAESRPRARAGGSSLASQRRGALVKLAAGLFAKKGYQATTVREIADEAGILSGSFYHHFDSKESIVDEAHSSFLEDLPSNYRAIVKRGGGPARSSPGSYRHVSPQPGRKGPPSPSSRTTGPACSSSSGSVTRLRRSRRQADLAEHDIKVLFDGVCTRHDLPVPAQARASKKK